MTSASSILSGNLSRISFPSSVPITRYSPLWLKPRAVIFCATFRFSRMPDTYIKNSAPRKERSVTLTFAGSSQWAADGSVFLAFLVSWAAPFQSLSKIDNHRRRHPSVPKENRSYPPDTLPVHSNANTHEGARLRFHALA